jgi:transcriptional regulator with XRE-family HTH domain
VEQSEVHQRGLVIYVLRTVRNWTQEDLAMAMDTSVSAISGYENGKRRPSQRALHRAAAAAGLTFDHLRRLLTSIGDVREAMEFLVPRHGKQSVGAVVEERCRNDIEAAVLKGVLAALQDGETLPLEGFPAPESGRLLWNQLERHRMEDRKRLVDGVESYRSWDLCELLCEESRDAAEEGEDASLELAELALYIAERIPGGEELRACAQAFAWAHLGHARRQLGDRTGAEEAFGRFRELRDQGSSMRLQLLDDTRIASLEALVLGEIGSLH